MNYSYQASKVDRQVVCGYVEAISEKMAEEALYHAGYKYVLKLRPQAAAKSLSQIIPTIFGVKTQDIIEFSRQLAIFLDSGSSLRVGLELLRDQAGKAALRELISKLISRLDEGVSLSQAVKDQGNVFPVTYWQVLQSSEKAGDLTGGLKQMAKYMERRAQINDRIRRALAYPIFVCVLALAVAVLLITTVIPPILKLFSSFGTKLPAITVVTVGLMNFVLNYKFYILLMVGLIVLAFWVLSRFAGGRLLLDRVSLKIPVLGAIMIQNSLGHFCRTASMLIAAGLPLPAIMDVSISAVSRNRVILQSLSNLKARLLQGEGLAGPISRDKLFPIMMARMVTVGEQTGTLDNSLATLADYFEEHANKKIQSLISLIEPGLTLMIGVGIAFLMLSMIVPIYSIINKVH